MMKRKMATPGYGNPLQNPVTVTPNNYGNIQNGNGNELINSQIQKRSVIIMLAM